MGWFNSVREFLAQGLVGSIIGILGIVGAVFIYFLTRQRTVFCYKQSGVQLLGLAEAGLPKDFTVQYQGTNIPRLTRTLIAIWNNGEKIIDGDDVVSTDPLRVCFADDSQVLTATVLKQTRDVCRIEASQSQGKPSEVVLSFAFLDTNDGAVLEILHTSEKSLGKIFGTIKGLPRGLREISNDRDIESVTASRLTRFLTSSRYTAWFASFSGFVVTVIGIYASFTDQVSSNFANAVFLTGFSYMLLGFIGMFWFRRQHPKVLHF